MFSDFKFTIIFEALLEDRFDLVFFLIVFDKSDFETELIVEKSLQNFNRLDWELIAFETLLIIWESIEEFIRRLPHVTVETLDKESSCELNLRFFTV